MGTRERRTRRFDSDDGPTYIRAEPTDVAKKKRRFKLKDLDVWLMGALMVAGFAALLLYSYFSPYIHKLPSILGPTYSNTTWGTYRPHLYFGLRARHPTSPLFGMMWYEQPTDMVRPDIRHWCEQGDNLKKYYWYSADGRTFGRQNISDHNIELKTDWINTEKGFTAKIHITPRAGRSANVIFYLTTQSSEDSLFIGNNLHEAVKGSSREFGDMQLSIKPLGSKALHSSFSTDAKVKLDRLHDYIIENTRVVQGNKGIYYMLNEDKTRYGKESRIAATQLFISEPTTIQVTLTAGGGKAPPREKDFDRELEKREKAFKKKFDEVFVINDKNFSPEAMTMANVALSNMLGSLGYWFGFNKVEHGNYYQTYGPNELFSAVPSRPFFPRGFLWDEGFHNMLIRKFDPKMSLEIITSWLSTMDSSGWMPREMILGHEAESKVPVEFILQRPDVANPPSLFYVLERLVNDKKVLAEYGDVLKRLYPRVELWFNWLATTQSGNVKNEFRWRGRNETTTKELNPKTLASGLDDFPRASHPSSDELHLDLRCWLAMGSKVLAKLAQKFGQDADYKKYTKMHEELSNIDDIARNHWSEKHGGFYDFGKHSDNVGLTRVLISSKQGRRYELERVSSNPPTLKLVTNAYGYVNLFPLMLRLIPENSDYLKATLDKIHDPEELWTPYGLRSLSKRSPYYQARNTEHDPPYWRGYIWINMNYMTLSALRHYADLPGKHQKQAETVFQELRSNLVNNLATNFKTTGFLWENYDDETGEGRGCRPFTGWSSLVLMIMSDNMET